MNVTRNGYNTVLYAYAPDGTALRYIGGIKLARKGDPVYFANESHAEAIARNLREQFPVLHAFKFVAQ